jgi:hypothetical protein
VSTEVRVLGRGIGVLALVATGLTAAQLVLRAWIGYRGWFSLDDYVFYTKAAELPLFDHRLLFEAYNSHLMPGAMIWVWLTTRAAPLNFAVVMSTSLLLQLAVDLAVLFVLRRLFGPRKAILLPYALFLFTTISLPAMLWWAAALNQLPQQLFTALAVIAHLGYVRDRRVRSLVLALLSLIAGLAFSEKTVFAIPLLFALTWMFCTPGSLVSAFFAALRRYWVAWAAYAVVLVPYLIYYVTQVSTPAHSGATTRQAVDLLDVMLRRGILPGLLGGPWQWEPTGWVDSFAAPPAGLQLLAAVVVAAIVIGTSRRRVNAYRAWLMAGLYLLMLYVTLLLTRVQVTSIALGAEYRYFTDFAFVAALALGLATIRTRPELVAGSNEPVLGRVRPLTTSGPVLDAEAVPVAAAMAVGLIAASATYSAYTFGERWTANPGKPYFANARTAIGQLGPDAVVYDGSVPSEVVWRLLWPANVPSRLLRPIGLRATPMGEGVGTRRLLEFSQQGTLQDSRVNGPVSRPGTSAGCGYSVGTEPVRIPLTGDAFYWNWVVQFDLVARTPTTLTVQAGRTTAEVPLAAGQRSVYVGVVGEVDAVTVSRQSDGPDVCVRSLTVGLPQPPAW